MKITFSEWLEKENKTTNKDNIFAPPLEPQLALNFLCDYLLGENWYSVNSIKQKQINAEIVGNILYKYSKRYRKELKVKDADMSIIEEQAKLKVDKKEALPHGQVRGENMIKYKIIYAIPATSEPDIIDKDVDENEWAYMMNDFEVVYDYQTNKYTVDFETMLCFRTDDGARNWIAHCVDKMTDYMVTHNLSVLKELNLYEVFTQGINVNTKFDSLEDLYAFLKFTVFGFHGQGVGSVGSEEE